MTQRYRDLAATSFTPTPVRRLERPEKAQWGSLSLSLDGDFYLTYYREGLGSTILDGTGRQIALETPERKAFSFPKVQRFADGRWLMVEARTSDIVPNAFVFGPDGSFSHSFYVGDGIETVLVDRSDRIWVGYFDEGIFGGGEPISLPRRLRFGPQGLVRVDGHGVMEFGFNDAVFGRNPSDTEEPEPLDLSTLTAEEANALYSDPRYTRQIGDIYALTIDDEDRIWLCPYSGFYVASIDNDIVDFVLDSAPSAGASAMCVGPNHFVFFGGYDRDCMVTVVERASQRLRLIQLRDQKGAPLPLQLVATRGGTVIAIADDRLYRLDLDILLDALGPWRDDNSTTVASAVQYREEEASYGETTVFILKESGLGSKDFPGTPRPPGNQPRNYGCGE